MPEAGDSEYRRVIAELRQERTTLRGVLEALGEGLLLLGADGRIRYLNQRAASLLNLDPEDAVGKSYREVFEAMRGALADPEDAWQRWEHAYLQVHEYPSYELALTGTPRREIALQLFPLLPARGPGPQLSVGVTIRDVTEARHVVLVQERERIAMDLHDSVVQALYGVGLTLGAEERLLGDRASDTRHALRRARIQLNDVIREIRDYIFALQPAEPARGLRRGLRALARELVATTLVHPDLELDPDADDRLGADATGELLRVAQEAVSNVIRHAGATRVSIRLERVPGRLVLSISDNGQGFDTGAVPDTNSHGLRNMASRAGRLRAELRVSSRPGEGTEVRIEVPLPEEAKEENARD